MLSRVVATFFTGAKASCYRPFQVSLPSSHNFQSTFSGRAVRHHLATVASFVALVYHNEYCGTTVCFPSSIFAAVLLCCPLGASLR